MAKGTSADSNVKRAVAAIGGMRRFVHTGDTVVIKPNIAHPIAPKYAVTTSPGVVASLVRLARAAGASRVLVMDNSSGGAPSACYAASGVAAAVKAAGGTMVVMGAPGFRTYAIPGHLLKRHPVYAAVVNANVLINVPIAKQHHSTGLTLAGKNMMGAISDRARLHQLGLSQSIAEINALLRPELTVIDAMRHPRAQRARGRQPRRRRGQEHGGRLPRLGRRGRLHDAAVRQVPGLRALHQRRHPDGARQGHLVGRDHPQRLNSEVIA